MLLSLTAVEDSLVRPLDGCRRRALRMSLPALRPFLMHRERRVAAMGLGVVLASLALTGVAPLWLLALSPILFGVPHLLSDVRYLVVRPGLHRRRWLSLLALPPLLLVSVTGHAAVGFLGVAAAGLLASGPAWRRVGVALAALGLGAWAWRFSASSALVLAHLHNLVAVGLWWGWRRRAGAPLHAVPLVVFALCTAAILGGALDGFVRAAPAELDLGTQVDWLAPGFASPWGERLVLSFAFAQAVHYGIWTRLIPEEDRPRPALRGFRASFDALRAEMGRPVLYAFGLAALVIAAWAVADLSAARSGYFRLALFHGHLEYAALALAWVERRQ
jgi:hypothetical protein